LFSAEFIIQIILGGILIGGVYSLMAIGLNLIFGVMKIINFAHGSLMMLSMYATYWLFALLNIDPYVSLIISVPLLFVIGAIIQKVLMEPVLEAPEFNQLLLTMGLMLFLENLAMFLWKSDYRTINLPYFQPGAIYIGEIMISTPMLIAFLCSILFMGLLYLFLKKTDTGKAIQAASQDHEGALTVGISVRRIYVMAFGIGSACVGAAGTLSVPIFYISPDVGGTFVLLTFVVVVLGGMGSFGGAFLGGLIVGVAEAMGSIILPGSMKQVVTWIIFVLVLVLRPSGLLGEAE
jgi:branched-chain amino acid transport system permease protein